MSHAPRRIVLIDGPAKGQIIDIPDDLTSYLVRQRQDLDARIDFTTVTYLPVVGTDGHYPQPWASGPRLRWPPDQTAWHEALAAAWLAIQKERS